MSINALNQFFTILFLLSNVTSENNRRVYKRDTENNFISLEEYERRPRATYTPPVIIAQTTSSSVRVSPVEEVKQSTNPCDPYITPERNFTGIGRRISESKCLEYIWNLKVRDERYRRNNECYKQEREKYLLEHPEERYVHAVFGGRETLTGEFPHMGAIGWLTHEKTWIFKCGSSLISHNFILTAAHCTSASPRDTTVADIIPKIVRLGDKNIMDKVRYILPQRDITISQIIVHPKFTSPYRYYDIALMKLKDKVIFTDHIQPACLWQDNDISELGSQGTVTGWGVVESHRSQYSPRLLAGNVDFLETEKCNTLLSHYFNRFFDGVVEHQVCAGNLTGGVDACQGDSGGPLQVKMPLSVYSQGQMHYLVGVTSFGVKCGLPFLPGVYTRVSAFIDWIEPIVWPNNTG